MNDLKLNDIVVHFKGKKYPYSELSTDMEAYGIAKRKINFGGILDDIIISELNKNKITLHVRITPNEARLFVIDKVFRFKYNDLLFPPPQFA